MRLLANFLLLATAWRSVRAVGAASKPSIVYGANLGNFLVSEGWMGRKEWEAMGGQFCDNACNTCLSTEGALAQSLGQAAANSAYQTHWESWWNETDVQNIANVKLNAIRIPTGYWIVEGLVEQGEIWPQGGILQLKRALGLLNSANIAALISMHAMPGIAQVNQIFAGLCTTTPQFYQPANYDRALQWAAVYTALSHLDPDFSSVYGIEGLNEPVMNASLTPGLQDYYNNVVRIVRSVEVAIGVTDCPGTSPSLAGQLGVTGPSAQRRGLQPPSSTATATRGGLQPATTTVRRGLQAPSSTAAVRDGLHHIRRQSSSSTTLPGIIAQQSDLAAAINVTNLQLVLQQTLTQVGINTGSGPAANLFSTPPASSGGAASSLNSGSCLVTTFMYRNWQFPFRNIDPRADASQSAIGPVNYDNHVYLSFNNVAGVQQTFDSYMNHTCNFGYDAQAASFNNTPLIIGEYWLSTNFNTTQAQYQMFGDAQKAAYSNSGSGGWFFWATKVTTNGLIPRDYVQSVGAGYLTPDPSQYFNDNVCASYPNTSRR